MLPLSGTLELHPLDVELLVLRVRAPSATFSKSQNGAMLAVGGGSRGNLRLMSWDC